MPESKCHPFSNGTSYMDWKANNCDRCKHGYSDVAQHWPCDLEKAIDEACIYDGSIEWTIARRMGLSFNLRDICSRCHEFEPQVTE